MWCRVHSPDVDERIGRLVVQGVTLLLFLVALGVSYLALTGGPGVSVVQALILQALAALLVVGATYDALDDSRFQIVFATVVGIWGAYSYFYRGGGYLSSLIVLSALVYIGQRLSLANWRRRGGGDH